jgi:hypothetical protein
MNAYNLEKKNTLDNEKSLRSFNIYHFQHRFSGLQSLSEAPISKLGRITAR